MEQTGEGHSPCAEETLRIVPEWRDRMPGSTACMTLKGPKKFVCICRCVAAASRSSSAPRSE